MSFETATAPHPDDTIVALSSAPGGGRRAIVRVGGPKARAVVAALFAADDGSLVEGAASGSLRRLVPGSVRLSGVHSRLPADLYFFAGPHSYTGQDLAELHALGSPPLFERLVADLLAAGARPAGPGEFTLRAFLAGKMDLTRAEAVQAVVEAGTDADLKLALAQLAGGVARPMDRVRDDLLNLLADVEAGLDFADENIEFVRKPEALARLADAIDRLDGLRRQLDDRSVGGRPLRLALVGRPNAGKSSLFNALGTGPEALVGPAPGTTRDYLTRRLDLGGAAAELIDTAGWQDAASTVEEQAQHLGREQADRADMLLWCVEAGQRFDAADAARLAATGAEVMRVRTKIDVPSGAAEGGGVLACSAAVPGGTTGLLAALAERAASFARPPLAPSQSRCRHHVEACAADLRVARDLVSQDEPHELVALTLRSALHRLGELVGAVYTPDLLDRIFSRFCIGK